MKTGLAGLKRRKVQPITTVARLRTRGSRMACLEDIVQTPATRMHVENERMSESTFQAVIHSEAITSLEH